MCDTHFSKTLLDIRGLFSHLELVLTAPTKLSGQKILGISLNPQAVYIFTSLTLFDMFAVALLGKW